MNPCSQCGQILERNERSCPVCGTPHPENAERIRRSRIVIAAGAVGLLAAATGLVFLLIHRTPPPAPVAAPERKPAAVRLGTESTVVPIAVDEATLDELEMVPTAKFGFGYPRLIREGRVFEVPAGTTGISLEQRKTHVRVSVRLDATDATREGWVSLDWVHDPAEDWAPTLRERPAPIR